MNLPLLSELGLSEGQILVYESVLELGIAGIHKIQERTGIERRNIYDILGKLIDKGLISYTIEGKRRTYQCTHPGKIEEEIEKRKNALSKLEAQVPQITSLFDSRKQGVRAETYRGSESIKTLFNEMLKHKKVYFLGGNRFNDFRAPQHLQVWFGNWMIRRAEAGCIMHDLMDFGTHLKGLEPDKLSKHKKLLYKYCELPQDLSSPLVIAIFGDKVAQILWSEQSFAFVLDSGEIRDSFMKYFMHFWKDPW